MLFGLSALLFDENAVQIYVIDSVWFFSNNNYKEKYAYSMKSRSLIKRNILCIFYMGKCTLRAKSCSASGREGMYLISYAVYSCARQITAISRC